MKKRMTQKLKKKKKTENNKTFCKRYMSRKKKIEAENERKKKE